MATDSIFLSGWEYNRVLRSDPFQSVTSGLPAQALWNGSAQFWMFKDVYCTKESLIGDLAAAEDLGCKGVKSALDLFVCQSRVI